MKMIVDVNEMREKIIQEMGCRRLSDSSGHFAEKGQGKETLLSITGAVNIYAALGINLGNFHQRKEWAKRILRYQKANGEFGSGEGNEHSTAMAIAALNILGALPEKPIRVSAPVEVKNLPSWLNNRDWSSTLKDLWGGVTPLLASGLCSSEWIETFIQNLTSRLSPHRPLEIWCKADDARWKVISCIYHVLSAFDAGCIAYPYPEIIFKRLMDLNWQDIGEDESRTVCTDGDWTWLLQQLCCQLPQKQFESIRTIKKVSKRRIKEWHSSREKILKYDIHSLYCYLWVTSVFQSMVKEDFFGSKIWDTLNCPFLFRLYNYV